MIDLKETLIVSFTPEGILMSNGTDHKLDMVIFATGFDAIDGNYNRVRIRGAKDETLKDHWEDGPTSYLGMTVPHFPNMFIITGPQRPFCNIPPAIEVDLFTRVIMEAEARSTEAQRVFVELTREAEAEWERTYDRAVENSLFKETASWIFGANVPGNTAAVRFYFGGLKAFRAELQKVINGRFRGFRPLSQA